MLIFNFLFVTTACYFPFLQKQCLHCYSCSNFQNLPISPRFQIQITSYFYYTSGFRVLFMYLFFYLGFVFSYWYNSSFSFFQYVDLCYKTQQTNRRKALLVEGGLRHLETHLSPFICRWPLRSLHRSPPPLQKPGIHSPEQNHKEIRAYTQDSTATSLGFPFFILRQ